MHNKTFIEIMSMRENHLVFSSTSFLGKRHSIGQELIDLIGKEHNLEVIKRLVAQSVDSLD